ncbi:MAG TPA: endonuclease/exonuclease/phosphatase family protein [Tepidisphaeraceae bacterium]|nr:endonuclease/exonuclease/phosphatase family protein [Tepidisphaeraceae bacterium]
MPMRRKTDRPQPPSPRSRASAAVARMSWAYFFVLLAIWIFLRTLGDRWWLGTIMLFGPVWVTALPLAVLVPGALIFHRKSLPILLAAGGVAVFLLMGFCLPWRAALQRRGIVKPLRVLTCNVHGKSVLNKLIAANDPDIVLLQEWPGTREKPVLGVGPWQVREDGELLIASRYPIVKSQVFTETTWSDWGGSAARYDIAAPGGIVHVFNIHLASPHRPFDALMAGKPAAAQRLDEYLQIRTAQSQLMSQLATEAGGDVILAGDFNTPCEGRVYHRYWSDFSDAYTAAGFGLGHTYFAHGASVRIDHVLMGSKWQCRECTVGPYVGSPHRPVVADLERVSGG